MGEFGGIGGIDPETAPAQVLARRQEQLRAGFNAYLQRRHLFVTAGRDGVAPTDSSATEVHLLRQDLYSLTTIPPGGTEVIPVWDPVTNKIRFYLP